MGFLCPELTHALTKFDLWAQPVSGDIGSPTPAGVPSQRFL